MSKRKAGNSWKNRRRDNAATQSGEPDHSALFVQAHEADIVRGPVAHASALALEIKTVDREVVAGNGLIRWRSHVELSNWSMDGDLSETRVEVDDRNGIWVDRYAGIFVGL
jgi:uncharacterized membrane-anchored protein